MIKQVSSMTENSKKIFFFKNVENSCWKNNILIIKEKVNFFSEKIVKKALQEK